MISSMVKIVLFVFPLIYTNLALSNECGINKSSFYSNLKKTRVLDVENAKYNSMGQIIQADILEGHVGWEFESHFKFKDDHKYKSSCCEFRQYLTSKWIKDGKSDFGDGQSGYRQTHIDFRHNLIQWPNYVEDTGGAYGHRQRVDKLDKWQSYKNQSYSMKDKPGTGGAQKSHKIIFNFEQRIIDICNDNKIIIKKELSLKDFWDKFTLESSNIIRDIDDD